MPISGIQSICVVCVIFGYTIFQEEIDDQSDEEKHAILAEENIIQLEESEKVCVFNNGSNTHYSPPSLPSFLPPSLPPLLSRMII